MKLYSKLYSVAMRPCAVVLLLASLAFSTGVAAQEATVSTGASSKTANGSLSFSFGQVAAMTYSSIFVPNEGVQQPFQPTIDTIKVEVCQGEGYYERPFSISGSQLSTPGTYIYQDTVFSGNSFGGDSIVILQITVNQNTSQSLTVKSKTDFFCSVYGTVTLYTDTIIGNKTLHFAYSVDDQEFQDNPFFDSLTPGTHTAKILAADACRTYITFTIEDKTKEMTPSLSESHTDAYCDVKSTVTLTPEGGTSPFKYLLDGGDTLDNNVIADVAAGNHSVIVVDNSGCVDTLDFTIGDSSAKYSPSLSVSGTTDAYCRVLGTATVSVTGGTQPFLYKIDEREAQSTPNFDTLSKGNHTVIVTDKNGCTDSKMVNIKDVSVDHAPQLKVGASTPAYCEVSASVTISATGGTAPYTYQIGENGTPQADATFTNLQADSTYNFVVYDNAGCPAKLTYTPEDQSGDYAPTVTVSSQTDFYCNVLASVVLSATDGAEPYYYSMDGGEFTTDATFSKLAKGSHSVIVKDKNGCRTDTTISIADASDAHKPLLAAASKTDAYCNILADLTMSATPQEGLPDAAPYKYKLDTLEEQNSPSFSGLAAGSHSVTVTDANGCQTTTSVVIDDSTSKRAPQLAVESKTEAYCNILANLTMTSTPREGFEAAPYQYKLDTFAFQSSPSFSDLAAGNHTVSVIDANGCQTTISVTIDDSTSRRAPQLAVVSMTEAYCNVPADLTMTSTPREGFEAAPYQYKLDTFALQSSPSFSGLTAGDHTVSVVDGNGCQTTMTVTIADSTPVRSPKLTVASQTEAYCSILASATLNATGGDGNYSYQLDEGSTQPSATFTDLAAGEHPAVVIDGNGCRATVTVTIADSTAKHNPTLSVESKTFAYCNVKATLQVSADNGVAPYSYKLDSSAAQSSPTFTNMDAGTYSVNVTDKIGCQTTISVTIDDSTTARTPILAEATNEAAYCSVLGSFSVASMGGQVPFSYQLLGKGPAQSSPSFDNLAAGTYTVTVTDANKCTSSKEFTIADATESHNPVLSVESKSSAYCDIRATLTMTVEGGEAPYTYRLGENGTQTAPTFTNLAAGTYTIQVTDANNCSSSMDVTIENTTYQPKLSFAERKDFSCLGKGSVAINVATGVAPYVYNLEGEADQDSARFVNLEPGSYTAHVVDSNGCENTINIEIKDITKYPTASVSSKTDLSCAELGTITLSVSGGEAPYTYQLDDDEVFNTATIKGLYVGNHTVVVRGNDGCTSTVNFQISDISSDGPRVNIASQVDATCTELGSVTISAFGTVSPYTYSIDGGESQTSATFTGLTVGRHSVQVTDGAGCKSYQDVNIADASDPGPVLSVASQSGVTCLSQGAVTIEAFGGVAPYSFKLNNGATQDNGSFSNLETGDYTITVTGNDGCSSSMEISIVDAIASRPTLVVESKTDAYCSDLGSVTLAVTGGTAPYTYQLYEGASQSSNVFSSVRVGNYMALVTDANGCTATTEVSVDELATDKPVLTVTSQVSAYCAVPGSVTLDVTGGRAPYTYLVDDTAAHDDLNIDGLKAGSHSVLVTDANGCSSTIIVNVNDSVIPGPTLALVSQTAATCNSKGSATLSASGSPAHPYVYWADEGEQQFEPVLLNLAAGTHTLYVADSLGCQSSVPVTINQNAVSLDVTAPEDQTVCQSSVAQLSATVTGGTAPYTYLWTSTPDANGIALNETRNDIMVQPSRRTTYYVTVTDANGCEGTATTTINLSSSVATHTLSTAYDCFSYTWNVNGVTYNEIGTNVYVNPYLEDNGCTAVDSLVLTIYGGSHASYEAHDCNSYTWDRTGETYTADSTVIYRYTDDNACPSTDTLRVQIGSIGNTAHVVAECESYDWMIGGVSVGTYLRSGTYRHDYTDSLGCVSTDTLHLTIHTGTHNAYDVYQCNSYTWTSGGEAGFGNDVTYAESGTYTNDYLDANGCVSTDTLHLFMRFGGSSSVTRQACDSYTWVINGETIKTYYESGTYYHSYDDSMGCDGFDKLHLTLGMSSGSVEVHNVCDSLVLGDTVYRSSSNTATYRLTNSAGCDSIIHLHINVSYSSRSDFSTARCDSFFWDGTLYTESTSFRSHETNVAGCDSSVNITLVINHSDHTYDTIDGCDQIVWNGRTYTESGNTVGHFPNMQGCDSAVSLHLNINYSTTGESTVQTDNYYTIGGETYVKTDTYNVVLANANSVGCDSLVSLNLTIISGMMPHIVAYENITVMIDHYPHGKNSDGSGDYVDYHAYHWYHDGTLIPSATSEKYYKHGYIPLSGTYYVEVPTDESLRYWVRSNEIDFGAAKSGIAEQDNRFTVYPNPVNLSGMVNVVFASDEMYLVEGSTLKVYDIQGRTMYAADVTSTTLTFPASFARGVYTVVYQVPNRDAVTVKLIVK